MEERDKDKIGEAMRAHRTHDFYTGRGPNARFLGSASLDANVAVLADRLISPYVLWREGNLPQKYTETVWELRVRNLLQAREEIGSLQVFREWPHPYKNSLDTDYSWWFDSGGLYIYNLGALVEIRYPNGGIKSKLRFPDYTPKENA